MPSSNSARTSSGSTAEHVGRGERRVQEVHRAQVRARLGQHPPEQREVVVLHEDGVALAGPRRHDVGHRTVVGPVALPRLPPVAVEARPVRQVEEVMMAVPQRRVGDDVVGLPVGLVVDDHGQQIEPVLVHEALGDRLAVRRPHRHRGPRRAAPREDPVQGRGQAAAGGHRDQRAVGPGAEGQRAAVGDDEVAAHWGDTGPGASPSGDALESRPQHVDRLGPQLVQRPVAVDALAQVDLGQAVGTKMLGHVDQQAELDPVAAGEAQLLEDPAVRRRLARQGLAYPGELAGRAARARDEPPAR